MIKHASHLQRSDLSGSPGFTLIELLVVLAIIAILASLILPALTGAKARAQRVRCLSNLRQFGLGLNLYTEENQERFPFPGFSSPHPDSLFHYLTALQPYVPTNGSFYVCPADRGPFTIPYARSLGMNTNRIVPGSYVLLPGFFHENQGGLASLRPRSVGEVTYPSHKVVMECAGITGLKELDPGRGPKSTVHAPRTKPGSTCLFVDGHAEFCWWDRFRTDPELHGLGYGFSSLGWRDIW